MTRGKFIAFEGGEGTGKSTQLHLLAQTLTERGIDHVVTREPGGTKDAEALRELLLDPAKSWGARAEALLFAAARADHVDRLIRPALAHGQWILCDRYLASSRAYQGAAGGISQADLTMLHQFGSEGLLPDMTFVLQLDPDVALARAAARDVGGNDRIGGRHKIYHAQVNDFFQSFVQADDPAVAAIAAHGSPQDVHRRIVSILFP
ncbi:dTMP kinase [Croceicoccus sp. F390]|uniref:Thymidylate kinase n=1 Tax=Croceicoccus esteveae TaxID=3075597 RepID=A0ABU2ZJ57_9SPHN|nr:dTMP kinase [Croceicoccus sp. F390]MDT0576643.1 dTMP kinase [Croceicoccus sp. F390]